MAAIPSGSGEDVSIVMASTTADLVVGDHAFCRGRIYEVVDVTDATDFCVLADPEGETIMEHRSALNYENRLACDVAWVVAEEM